MNQKIRQLLENREENHILPFFWQHGEPEEVLREYMGVIHSCGIGAVCVESRPHPDFAGEGWWHDMDIILDEARQRNMKVWILDDSHFPSGYANGALEKAEDQYRRQSLVVQTLDCPKTGETMEVSLKKYEKAAPWEPNQMEKWFFSEKALPTFGDDQIVGIAAFRCGGTSENDLQDLSAQIEKGTVRFIVPQGVWKIAICHLTRNRGPHRDYINMMDRDSCRVLLDAVYEPHYAHYASDFGTTIAGFFSDEPEIGNGHLYDVGLKISQLDDQAWSREVEQELKETWGCNYGCFLPFLWEQDFDAGFCAKIRYDYMNAVTKAVERDFSCQIGGWCREHGVQYIGHMIEDNGQHTRTGSGLGHYFRGMAGQDMAGIDDIGGQVLPQGEELPGNPLMPRDGHFYHFTLAKLASSDAAIDPVKKGRSMCEIFGNYGWSEGIKLEKYLIDHFLVRGINHFVPHAFSPMAFPDPDCPPHFYAHGHNPQFRHFGMLMRYANRICTLISDGMHIAPAAVLYHAESDWCGTCMPVQEPGRVLAEGQIDYDFLPADVFEQRDFYGMEILDSLQVNGRSYRCLVVSECQFIPGSVAKAIRILCGKGIPVYFINGFPEGFCEGGKPEPGQWDGCQCVSLSELAKRLHTDGVSEIKVHPENPDLRYLHYKTEQDLYMFVNEGNTVYEGSIRVPQKGQCYAYDTWNNRLETVRTREYPEGTVLDVRLEPLKSLVVIFDTPDRIPNAPLALSDRKTAVNEGWKRSVCRSIAYPDFGEEKSVCLPDTLAGEMPLFSGFVRYEKEMELSLKKEENLLLELTDAAEGVEVFVNGNSAGIQIPPFCRYDLTPFWREGRNVLCIEIATTLEREMSTLPNPMAAVMGGEQNPSSPSGINGRVYVEKTI